MLCLHGKPAVASTTENGTFWTCSEPSACFVCSEEEKQLYDKGIKTFLATKQDRPKCCGIVPADQKDYISQYWVRHRKSRSYEIDDFDTKPPKQFDPWKYLGPRVSAADAERHYAKFRVYTGKERYKWWFADKKDIGRPFFTCGKNVERNPRGCAYFEWGDKNIVTKPLCYHGSICKVKGKAGERPILGCTRKDYPCNYFEWGDPPNEDPASKKRRLERLSRLSKEEKEDPWLSY